MRAWNGEEFGVNRIAVSQTLRRLAAALTLSISGVVCAIAGAACAEPLFSFEGTPGKLPKTVGRKSLGNRFV